MEMDVLCSLMTTTSGGVDWGSLKIVFVFFVFLLSIVLSRKVLLLEIRKLHPRELREDSGARCL